MSPESMLKAHGSGFRVQGSSGQREPQKLENFILDTLRPIVEWAGLGVPVKVGLLPFLIKETQVVYVTIDHKVTKVFLREGNALLI